MAAVRLFSVAFDLMWLCTHIWS